MSFGNIIGHRRPIEELGRALASDRLPHALLVHGPGGVGKATLGRALATALLSGDPPDPLAERKIAARVHPDLMVVRRVSREIREKAPMNDLTWEEERELEQQGELSPFIRVFQIRELAEHAAYAPREASCRVFLIDPADRMNPEAQNALLKTLEEPPGRTFLILVASRPHLLLPTVRSRCYAVGLAPIRAAELARALEGRGVPRAEAIARAALARGRPGRALSLDLDQVGPRRDELLRALEALAGGPEALAKLPELVSALGGKTEEALVEGLDLFEELLRDATRVAAGLDTDVGPPRLMARLGQLGRRLGPARCAALVASAERLRGELRLNLNRTLVTESLLAAVAGGPLP